MSARLTDVERATLLVPCECGHTINDHGTWCWYDDEHYCQCQTSFETLLTDRVAIILAAHLAAAEQRGRDEVLAEVEALASQANDEALTHWYRHNEAADDGDLDRANREGEVAEVFDQTRSALRALLAQHEGETE